MGSTSFSQAAFHYVIHDSYGPLEKSLPLSLAYLSHGMPAEEGHEGSILEGSDAEFDPRPTAVKRQSQLRGDEATEETIETDDEGAFERYSDTSEDRQRLRRPSLPAEKEKQVEMADLGRSEDFAPRSDVLRQRTALTSEEREAQQEDAARERTGDDYAQRDPARAASPATPPSNTPAVHPVDFAAANTEANGTDDPVQHSATKQSAAERSREDYDADAFAHPATKEPQRIIWLPEDELGLAEAEVKDNLSVGIASTTKDAVLDKEVSCVRPRGDLRADALNTGQGRDLRTTS